MPDNGDLGTKLGTLAPNSNALEVIREISLVDLGDAFKDCTPLNIRVNPPAIFNEMLQTELEQTLLIPREKILRALNIFTDISVEDLAKWSDPLLFVVFRRARALYWEYWTETKNLPTR